MGDRRVQLEAQGRRLVVHSATGYEDYGASLAASVGEISGERYERSGGKPDHRVGMFGVVNLGSGRASPETVTNGDPTPRVAAPVPAAVPGARQPAPLRSKLLLAVWPLDRPFMPAPEDGAAVSETTLAVAPTVPACR